MMKSVCIDIGNQNCYMAGFGEKGFEMIINDFGDLSTPSTIAFTDNQRLFGEIAGNQQDSNPENTITAFKTLLSKSIHELENELENKKIKVDIIDGRLIVQVNYLGELKHFNVEQIFAMFLHKLFDIVITGYSWQKSDIILTVPMHFKSLERQALINAAEIAGMTNVNLLNELTAIACTYGFSKLENFTPQTERNVVFIDFGHCSFQISIVAFTRGEFRVLETSSTFVGGRDFDMMLSDFFIGEFLKKYNIKLQKGQIEYLRLLKESEKIKKQMSTNSTNLILKVSNILKDEEEDELENKIKFMICRKDMETICDSLFLKIERTIRNCLENSKLNLSEIHSVEILGGSSRIPAFKQMIKEIFQKPPSTSLNQDEAVALGGSIYCEIKSNRSKFGNGIKIIDKLPPNLEEIVLEPQTLKEPLEITTNFIELPDFALTENETKFFLLPDFQVPHKIQLWNSARPCYSNSWFCFMDNIITKDIPERVEMKVLFSVNQDGIINLERGILRITFNRYFDVLTETASSDGIRHELNTEIEPLQKTFEVTFYRFQSDMEISLRETKNYRQFELEMIDKDYCEKLRIDSRNELEEYIFEIKDGFSSQNDFTAKLISDSFSVILSKLESWLYTNDNETCEKSTYVNILTHLKHFNINEKMINDQQILDKVQSLKNRINAVTNSCIC